MLASVLRTSVASSVSIHIMRAFVVMKKYVSKTLLEQTYINNLVLKDSKRIDLIEETLSKFKEKSNHLFFEGQVYDAYYKINEIFLKSKKDLIIIDAYADITILDMRTNITESKFLLSSAFAFFPASLIEQPLLSTGLNSDSRYRTFFIISAFFYNAFAFL